MKHGETEPAPKVIGVGNVSMSIGCPSSHGLSDTFQFRLKTEGDITNKISLKITLMQFRLLQRYIVKKRGVGELQDVNDFLWGPIARYFEGSIVHGWVYNPDRHQRHVAVQN